MEVANDLRRRREEILSKNIKQSDKHNYPITFAFLDSLPLIRRSEVRDYEIRANQAINADYENLKLRGFNDPQHRLRMENIARNVISTMAIPDDIATR
jgi:hypothetical protein